MLLALLGLSLLASTPTLPSVSCLSSGGRTACGYACRASTSEVHCASTPYGVCRVLNGGVHCFDPPLVSVHHPPDEGLRPECKEVRGQVACGFHCLLTEGKVACARTPYGLCREHLGELTCWDPPASVIHEYGAKLPPPGCLTASTALGCGYDCKAARTEVRCAQTPRGQCVQDDFQLGCFDPPSLLECTHAQPPPPDEVRKPKAQRKEPQPRQADATPTPSR